MKNKLDNLSGKRFGNLMVLDYFVRNKRGNILWLCECDCGRFKSIYASSLRGLKTTNCGVCTARKYNEVENLEGRQFSRLKVLELYPAKRTKWLCECDCGRYGAFLAGHLKNGHTKSCGCIKKEIDNSWCITHNMSQSREFGTWNSMKDRCYNPNNSRYLHYGGRGIKVCDRWLESFENFYEDMGPKPKGLTLDRVNNDGDYCKENCRWATYKTQNRNRNFNLKLQYNGEIKCLSEWAEILGCSAHAITHHLDKGKDMEWIINYRLERLCLVK